LRGGEIVEVDAGFFCVDPSAIETALADNWGWITASGVLTTLLGAAALALPITATDIAYTWLTIAVGGIGFVGLGNIFFAPTGWLKLQSGLSGVLYLGLSYYMANFPLAGLAVIGLTVASNIALEGFYETALAIKYKDIAGRGRLLASGILSVVAAGFLTASLPVSSLILPGAVLGARWISNGFCKIALGLDGKALANLKK